MATVEQFLKQHKIARYFERRGTLAKSAAAGNAKGKRAVVNRSLPAPILGAMAAPSTPSNMPQPPADMLPPYGKAGGYVRVQRPNLHAAPILAQLISHGKHGIQCVDAQGTRIKVRHEHVLERDVTPTADERAAHITAQARRGASVDASERFLMPDSMGKLSQRPTAAQMGLLQEITRHGVPLDMARVQGEATQDDVQALLRRFINDPSGLVVRPKKRS